MPRIHEQIIGKGQKRIEQENIREFYKSIAIKIIKASFELDWFVKEAFTSDEIDEFKEVVKYTLMQELVLSYNNVKQDLVEMVNGLSGTDAAIEATYNIAFLSCTVPIHNPDIIELGTARWNGNPPKLATKFSSEFRRLLIEDAVTKLHEIKRGELSQKIAASDLLTLKSHVENIASGNELKSEAYFTGKGGSLEVEIHKATKFGFQLSILKSILTALLVTSGLLGVGYLLTKDISGFIILVISFGWIIIILVWGSVIDKFKEAMEYGRKRKRFAKN